MDLLRVAVTSLVSLAALFLLTKLMGNKQVSQMNLFDYIIGISIGSIAAEMATELDTPENSLLAMAVYAVVAVFCGAVNCPIASVFLSIELFGTGDLLYFAMACAISYLLSGYCGLYSSQTILYSKMRAEFINIHTNENEDRHG